MLAGASFGSLLHVYASAPLCIHIDLLPGRGGSHHHWWRPSTQVSSLARVVRVGSRPALTRVFANTRLGAPTRGRHRIQTRQYGYARRAKIIAPFGDAYEKIGTIQRRLAWPLHKDDTLFQSGRPTGLNIYFSVSSLQIFAGRSSAPFTGSLLTLWSRRNYVVIGMWSCFLRDSHCNFCEGGT
ncbi:hypothetical protein BC834DRAFT_962076 [Gloeopeniophorella convolvens]|nr:hypothetical protein BC834DRAFT_962076 [Gloeopeniophorella convolvens]